MGITDALIFADLLSSAMNILWVSLGLGLVIFFHELGHFAVAKWCNVHVERFSIGFGPVLFSFKKGETEYAISLIPFGGYVKMLGQDDMDPSQLTSEEIAEDPRSYSAKSVPQRMAIISAGVIMNIITGMLFYAFAFGLGVKANPPTIGAVRVGLPAWKAGLRSGDVVKEIDGREMESYRDVQMAVALSQGPIEMIVIRDGKKLDKPLVLNPDGRGTRRIIGVYPSSGTTLIVPEPGSGYTATIPGTKADEAGKDGPGFEGGDKIVRVDETEIPDFATLQRVLAEKRTQDVTFHVEREKTKEKVAIKVAKNPFRTLGLSMEVGPIVAVREGSPSQKMERVTSDGKTEPVSLTVGDRIAGVDDKLLGKQLNPLKLPEIFEEAARNRTTLKLKILRKEWGAEAQEVMITFTRNDPVLPAWTEPPVVKNVPLSIPSLGVAFHLIPTVIHVDENSPAAKAGIKEQSKLKKMVLSLPEGAELDGINKGKPLEIEFGIKDKNDEIVHNWAYAFWMIQHLATRNVELTVVDKEGKEATVTLKPELSQDWFMPVRGLRPEMSLIELHASGPVDSVRLGIKRARNSIVNVYMTISSLFGGRVSYKELSGPVAIFKVATRVAEQGFADLLLFLGFLSVNLAVLNFLPIPVLDGGHMVFLCWEGITRKKPSEKVMIAATYIGLAFVLCLMGLVLYLDLFVNWGK